MHKKFLTILRCPVCGNSLVCTSEDMGENILNGHLTCRSGHSFPVCGGVPDFVVNHSQEKSTEFQDPKTVESFGFEWNWDRTPRTEEDLQFRVLEKSNITSDFLKGKLVLDAGCGAGFQTKFIAGCGATVVGVDLSAAVKSAYNNNAHNENVCIIKADILRLPFGRETFDYIYSEGVLQHTKQPRNAFYNLVALLKRDGQVFATFYTRRQGIFTPFLFLRSPLRFILSKLPTKLCWYICWLSVPMNKIPLLKHFFRKTIVLYDKRNPGDKSTWALNYDFYGTHKYQSYFRPTEIVDIWSKSREKLLVLHSENGYPVRGRKQ